MSLTLKQSELLHYWRTYTAERGLPPTIKEAATYFGVAIPTIYERLQAMRRKGVVEHGGSANASRAWYAVNTCPTCGQHWKGQNDDED